MTVQTSSKTTATDWTKLDKSNKRRWKYSFQGNYTDYSYDLTLKSDSPASPTKVKCKTGLVGMSFDYKKQYESGFFNEGTLIFGRGAGDLKITPNTGKEEKFKLDRANMFEWKTKLGMLIPLNKDGDFKAGPFSGFDIYSVTFNISGRDRGGYKSSVYNSFFAFPLGIRTEYAKTDWKFGLDLEYDFVISEDSFKLLDSVDFRDEWSNGHIFLVTGNISKDFAEGRLALKLTPFYRYVDYGKCEYYNKGADDKPNTEVEGTGVSHEFGIKAGVQF